MDRNSFRLISINDMVVDDYQRPVNMKTVMRILNDFDEDIIGVVIVSHRDGRYHIVDGQHRVEVLKRKGYSNCICQVFEDMTYEQEAEKFCKLNCGRKTLSIQDKFVASVESGNKMDRHILDIINNSGAKFKRDFNSRNGYVSCVGTCREVYIKRGPIVLHETLSIIMKSWDGNHKTLSASMIRGLSMYLNKVMFIEGYNRDYIIDKLREVSPSYVFREATIYSIENDNYSIKHGSAILKVILNILS